MQKFTLKTELEFSVEEDMIAALIGLGIVYAGVVLIAGVCKWDEWKRSKKYDYKGVCEPVFNCWKPVRDFFWDETPPFASFVAYFTFTVFVYTVTPLFVAYLLMAHTQTVALLLVGGVGYCGYLVAKSKASRKK